jgi:LepB N-terminal domain/LepB GAP domain N-terminal subdomain/LepB GAP domain C-terminal subdomain
MPTYKGKVLTKEQNKKKKGGKNKASVNGFYKDAQGKEYFIKQPSDKKELFTELLAGLLLKEFMTRPGCDLVKMAVKPSIDYFKNTFKSQYIAFNDELWYFDCTTRALKQLTFLDGGSFSSLGLNFDNDHPATKKELRLITTSTGHTYCGLVSPCYFSSMICADFIKLDDGTYGLIQPKVPFTELYKIINSGYADNSDRDPIKEMFEGPSLYPALTSNGQYFGLSVAFMFSLLLSDYSVHSGNVVMLTKLFNSRKGPIKQFARIDWGAAFRHFNHPENNKDLLDPYEYQGFFNIKKFTKGYIANYKNLEGLFSIIAQRADILQKHLNLNPPLLTEIVSSAFEKIPADLLDPATQKNLASHLHMPSLATAIFGPVSNYQHLVQDFVDTLTKRLDLFKKIPQPPATRSPFKVLYQSALDLFGKNEPIVLTFNTNCTFLEQLTKWSSILEDQKKKNNNDIDFTNLDLPLLTGQFNHYLELLAHQGEVFNLWQHNLDSNENILVSNFTEPGDNQGKNPFTQKDGYAFIKQYRESAILRHLFTLDNQGGTSSLPNYADLDDTYKRKNPKSIWARFEATMLIGCQCITNVRMLKKLQEEQGAKDEKDISTRINLLIDNLKAFSNSAKQLHERFFFASQMISNVEFESRFFYPISDETLFSMSGDQLVTICFEELNDANNPSPSSLLARIIENDLLWESMNKAYGDSASDFNKRRDKPQDKIARLRQWREDYISLRKTHLELRTKETLEEKQDDRMLQHYQNLPEFLQDESLRNCQSLDEELKKNQENFNPCSTAETEQLSLVSQFGEQNKAFSQAKTVADKEATLSEMRKIFNRIHQDKQADHLVIINNAELELIRWQEFDKKVQAVKNKFTQTASMEEKLKAYYELAATFKNLPDCLLKQQYQLDIAYYAKKAAEVEFVVLFDTTIVKFDQAETIEEKRSLLSSLINDIVPKLSVEKQRDKDRTLETRILEFSRWNERIRAFNEGKARFDAQTTHYGVIAANQDLQAYFQALPEKLKGQYRKDAEDYANKAAAEDAFVHVDFKKIEFDQAVTVAEKEGLLQQIHGILQNLPQETQKECTQLAEMTSKLDELKGLDGAYSKAVQDFKNSEDKIAAGTPLEEAFNNLPAGLKEKYQGEFDGYKNEVDYLQCLKRFSQPIATLSGWKTAYYHLAGTFNNLSAPVKQSRQASYDLINAKKERYLQFRTDNHEEELLDRPLIEVDDLLSRLQSGSEYDSRFTNVVLKDPILWDIVAYKNKKRLSAEVVQDIMALKEFYDRKVRLNEEKHYEDLYKTSLDAFYTRAVTIRLSDDRLQDQAKQIVKAAHEEFHHRHDSERFIADVLMVFSHFILLGLFIGVGRLLAGKTYFFSSAKTDREEEFTRSWLKKSEFSEENNARLLSIPVIA